MDTDGRPRRGFDLSRALMRWAARHPELAAAHRVDDFVDSRTRPEWGDQAQQALAAVDAVPELVRL